MCACAKLGPPPPAGIGGHEYYYALWDSALNLPRALALHDMTHATTHASRVQIRWACYKYHLAEKFQEHVDHVLTQFIYF